MLLTPKPLKHALKRISGTISQLKYKPVKDADLAIVELLKNQNISTSQASEALHLALTQRCATREVFNAYLYTHARQGDVEAVLRGVDVMRERGIEHNAETHAAVLAAYSSAGDTQGLLRAFEELRGAQGALSKETCGEMIVHFARNELMESLRTGYDNEKGGKGQNQIRNLTEEMRAQGIALTQRAYNALLELYMRTRNAPKLLQVWEDMKAQDVPRNIYSYNMVLEGLRVSAAATDKLDNMAKFLEVVKEMQEDKNAKPDTHTFNALFLANKSFPDESNSPLSPLLDSLVSASLEKPTVFTYNSLIHQYARERNFEKISETIARMSSEGINLDRVTYISLMKVSALQGPDAILKVFGELEKNKKPNTRTYQVLISELCKAGGEEIALKFYEKMKKDNLTPTEVCYIELIDALGAKNNIKKCIELYLCAEKDQQNSVIVRDKFLSYLEQVDPAGYLLTLLDMAKKYKSNIVNELKSNTL